MTANVERTIVAVGCSRDRDYSFLLPLTCLLWREHIGFHPVALLTASFHNWSEDPRTKVVLKAIIEKGFDYRFLGEIEGYPEHTLAQNCRQHAAALGDIDPDDWVMPGDADLWPIRRRYFEKHAGTALKAVVYYANGDHFSSREDVLARAAQGLRSQTLPTCHVAMRARDWRLIYSLKSGDVGGSVKQTLDAWFAARSEADPDKNLTTWCSDQQIMTEAVCQQSWFPRGVLDFQSPFAENPTANVYMLDTGSARFVARRGHPPVDRLDRSVASWRETYGPFDAARWTDAHVHRAPEEDGHWEDLLQIVDTMIPQHAAWARQYREAYVAAKNADGART